MAHRSQKLTTALHNPAQVPALIWRRLNTVISYNFSSFLNAYSSPPETINIYPTDRCNLRCSMCFVKFRKPEPELDTAQWLEIIDHIKTFYPRIHFSGGEPFLYRGIIKLMAHIKKNNLYCAITTNGTMLRDYARELIGLRINRINVSIDGPKKIHDTIRGVPGTFDRIVAGLDTIVALKGKKSLPELQIHSMINFSDPYVMDWVVNFAADKHVDAVKFLYPLFVDTHGVSVHRHLIQKTLNHDLNYWHKADACAQRPQDINETERVLERIQKTSGVSVEIFPPFRHEHLLAYYSRSHNFNQYYRGRCKAIWNTATILPSGNVESCPDYIIGNCREEKFTTLWNNQIIRSLRRRIRNRRFFTVCRACCFFYQ
jgi:MoaA/NifB/PqqE/SkfB family radical SAM enzyme